MGSHNEKGSDYPKEAIYQLKSLLLKIPKDEIEFRRVVEHATESGRNEVRILYQHHYDFYRLGLDNDFSNFLDMACQSTPDIYYQCFGNRGAPMGQKLPAIMLVTLYKSGTDYLSSKICEALEIPLVRILTGDWPTEVIPSWLTHFLAYGGLCVQHLQPTDINIHRLIVGGMHKLQVHVRDPRQAFLSAFHFEEKIVNENGKAAKTILSSLPTGYFEMSHEERLDLRVNSDFGKYFSKFVVDWSEARYRYVDRLEIQFSTFETMLSNERSFMNRFTNFFNLGANLPEKLSSIEGSRLHFRKGRSDEWKEILTPQQSAFLMTGISNELAFELGWEIPHQ